MKDAELLVVMSEKWESINSIKKKLNAHWNKIYSQLSQLEMKGLVEGYNIRRRNNTYRLYRLIKTDNNKLDIIERTEIQNRSNEDHKYIALHKYKSDWRKYIHTEILNGN